MVIVVVAEGESYSLEVENRDQANMVKCTLNWLEYNGLLHCNNIKLLAPPDKFVDFDEPDWDHTDY